MYILMVKNNFDAAHKLQGYEGICAGVHGHTWQVEAYFQVENLNNIGISVDFRTLKNILKEVLEEFDHVNLNELTYFKVVNPTAENVASLLFQKLKEKLVEYQDCRVTEVRVWESQNACCIYKE
ncbi:MAG: 6-carboxytetrahydropterin synthase QueD [Armatimonadota bacterium]